MTRDDVDERNMANRLKELFAAAKYSRDGRPYKPHKRFDDSKCWLATARVVKSLGATPEDYIEAQFRYSVSTLFANTLHGPAAQSRYQKFAAMRCAQPEATDNPDDIKTNTPGKAEVNNRIAGVVARVKSVCGDTSIDNPKVKSYVLDLYSNLDELGVMLFYGNDQDVRSKFLLPTKEILVQSPYLRRAVEELGIDVEGLIREQ